MTDPIVLRSEIISLLQSGGLGNAGTSGSESLASLNSQLISLTTRVAKLEGSTTYNEETATADSFWYDDSLGICAVSGSIILTSSLNAGSSIKLLTIDSDDHLPPNTDFLGVASAYMSNAGVGQEPTQLALSFDGLNLMATSEAYIPASSSSSWYVEFHSMWIQKGFPNSSSTVQNIGWASGVSGSNNYVYTITSGGVIFVFAYVQNNSSTTIISNASSDIANSYTFINDSTASIGQSSTKYSDGTCKMGFITFNTSSGANCIKVAPSEKSGVSYYGFGCLLSKTDSAITLAQTSKNNNFNTNFFGTAKGPMFSTILNYNGLTIIQIRATTKELYYNTNAFSPTYIISPELLAEDISASFFPIYCGSNLGGDSAGVIPVNVSNGKVIIQLKPDDVSGYLTMYGTIILIKKTA